MKKACSFILAFATVITFSTLIQNVINIVGLEYFNLAESNQSILLTPVIFLKTVCISLFLSISTIIIAHSRIYKKYIHYLLITSIIVFFTVIDDIILSTGLHINTYIGWPLLVSNTSLLMIPIWFLVIPFLSFVFDNILISSDFFDDNSLSNTDLISYYTNLFKFKN